MASKGEIFRVLPRSMLFVLTYPLTKSAEKFYFATGVMEIFDFLRNVMWRTTRHSTFYCYIEKFSKTSSGECRR